MACDELTVTTVAPQGVHFTCGSAGTDWVIVTGVAASVGLALLTALTVWKTWELSRATRAAAQAARDQVDTSTAALKAQTHPELTAAIDDDGRPVVGVSRTATRVVWATRVKNVGVGLATISDPPRLKSGDVATDGEIRPPRIPPGGEATIEFAVEQRHADRWAAASRAQETHVSFVIDVRYRGILSEEQRLPLSGSFDAARGAWNLTEEEARPRTPSDPTPTEPERRRPRFLRHR